MAKKKTKACGRNRRDGKKEAFWRRAVREQAESELGIRAFCRKQGVKEVSFYHWRRELQRRQGEANEASVANAEAVRDARSLRFAEVRVPAWNERLGADEIEIRRGEMSIRLRGGCDRTLLRDVLSLLSAAAC